MHLFTAEKTQKDASSPGYLCSAPPQKCGRMCSRSRLINCDLIAPQPYDKKAECVCVSQTDPPTELLWFKSQPMAITSQQGLKWPNLTPLYELSTGSRKLAGFICLYGKAVLPRWKNFSVPIPLPTLTHTHTRSSFCLGWEVHTQMYLH